MYLGLEWQGQCGVGKVANQGDDIDRTHGSEYVDIRMDVRVRFQFPWPFLSETFNMRTYNSGVVAHEIPSRINMESSLRPRLNMQHSGYGSTLCIVLLIYFWLIHSPGQQDWCLTGVSHLANISGSILVFPLMQ